MIEPQECAISEFWERENELRSVERTLFIRQVNREKATVTYTYTGKIEKVTRFSNSFLLQG